MSQSPSAAGAMGIGTMLNNKGGASGAAPMQGTTPDQHPGQPQLHPQLVMERANSPHGSEHSRYSGPMNTSYPSPTAMGGSLPAPSANMGPTHGLSALPPGMQHTMPVGPPVAQPPPKAYPCSTCGKGFARRSDLARHGQWSFCVFFLLSSLTRSQRGSTVVSDLMFATSQGAASSSFSAPRSQYTSGCIRAKSLTCANDVERCVDRACRLWPWLTMHTAL